MVAASQKQEKARVVWLGNGGRVAVPETAARLLPELTKRVRIIAEDFTGSVDMSAVEADYAIVLGGDGSVLRAIHQLGENQIPILAVNVGSLAFLSSLMPDELISFLDKHDYHDFPVQNNILLECSLWRSLSEVTDRVSECGPPNDRGELCVARRLVVNEVALLGGPPFEILHIELSVDGEPATTYHGDGVLISTSIGSTAHNLSSGGPIIRQGLDVVVISPLNPHSLSYRPVVDSADRTYELRILNREIFVVTDGDSSLTMLPGDRVMVRRAGSLLQLVRVPERGYYRTLREKLGWSGQIEGFDD
jgi:NAD+ kinase